MRGNHPEGVLATQALTLPAVPLTVEGSSVLHQMFRLRRAAWRAVGDDERRQITAEAAAVLEEMEGGQDTQTGLYALLGHKGDLLVLHFRRSFEELSTAALRVASLRLADYLEPAASYLSVVELGLYDSTVKLYTRLAERGIEPESEEWRHEVEETLDQHRKAMAPRLWPSIPPRRYLCFYPMDRKRDAAGNWYRLPITERQRLMHEHGEAGRKYARQVQQIISGSIGFDDWEWGVDLFADDPLVFKKLIYEMRFDEVSAVYAAFGPFYVGLRFAARDLATWLEGRLPPWPSVKESEPR
ncbi:MAG: hydrogen peroxide-dependent heme synthase [Bryobacterales bacterium]|nr:heme-dependent peroxidase [Bryobacteraceae bacterium]MDW8354336.1 hydrogen peroxide-dependent heme synthase [Bryobacterales bacterium]